MLSQILHAAPDVGAASSSSTRLCARELFAGARVGGREDARARSVAERAVSLCCCGHRDWGQRRTGRSLESVVSDDRDHDDHDGE